LVKQPAVCRRSVDAYEWQGAAWLLPYFGGIWGISQLSAQTLGGNDTLSFMATMVVSMVFSLLVMALALKTSHSDDQIRTSFDAMLRDNATPN
jgi:hypothetical protein